MILRNNNLKLLSGDASHRVFFRKFNKKSSIIVYAKKDKRKNLLIYSAINKILNSSNLSAPKLISENYKKNFIEITDFGDKTIFQNIKKKKNKFSDYKKIVELLVILQKINKKKIKNFNKKYYKLPKYSLKILIQESDYFFNWYLPLIFNKKKVNYMKKKYRIKLNTIYKKLKQKNNFFVHRDFHVSNLMYYKKKICIIDSQDALYGNAAYDLASLVDDVRIKTSKDLKNKILSFYLNKCDKKIQLNLKEFIHDFNILSVQRNLKILGIFARLFKRDKKNMYLKLLPYTWKLLDLRMKNNKYFNNIYRELSKDIPNRIKNKRFNEN